MITVLKMLLLNLDIEQLLQFSFDPTAGLFQVEMLSIGADGMLIQPQ